MERVPGELMETLTSGQRAATRMILETSDRFTVVQGYAVWVRPHSSGR